MPRSLPLQGTRPTGRPQEGQSGRDAGLLGQGVVSRGQPRATFCPAGPAQGCWDSRGRCPGCRWPAACGVGMWQGYERRMGGDLWAPCQAAEGLWLGGSTGTSGNSTHSPRPVSMRLLRETLPRTEPSSEAAVPAASGPSAPGQLSTLVYLAHTEQSVTLEQGQMPDGCSHWWGRTQ